MLALAEDLWSRPENKNYADFLRRLTTQLPRLDKQNVNYRIPEPAGLQNMVLGRTKKRSDRAKTGTFAGQRSTTRLTARRRTKDRPSTINRSTSTCHRAAASI